MGKANSVVVVVDLEMSLGALCARQLANGAPVGEVFLIHAGTPPMGALLDAPLHDPDILTILDDCWGDFVDLTPFSRPEGTPQGLDRVSLMPEMERMSQALERCMRKSVMRGQHEHEEKGWYRKFEKRRLR